MIFVINTTSDISKLLYVISRAFRRVKFETIVKYHEWYLCQISRTNHAINCLYYYPQKVVIFTCRYFKLSWNTTALSQSNCRNFSCGSIIYRIQDEQVIKPWQQNIVVSTIDFQWTVFNYFIVCQSNNSELVATSPNWINKHS